MKIWTLLGSGIDQEVNGIRQTTRLAFCCDKYTLTNNSGEELHQLVFKLDHDRIVTKLKSDLKKAVEKLDLSTRQWEMYLTDFSREDLEDIIKNDKENIEAIMLDECLSVLKELRGEK